MHKYCKNKGIAKNNVIANSRVSEKIRLLPVFKTTEIRIWIKIHLGICSWIGWKYGAYNVFAKAKKWCDINCGYGLKCIYYIHIELYRSTGFLLCLWRGTIECGFTHEVNQQYFYFCRFSWIFILLLFGLHNQGLLLSLYADSTFRRFL